ncbi:MAG TPA: helix-turn-helix domain-containing protein [Candidatus Tectomicrobia bacterium]
MKPAVLNPTDAAYFLSLREGAIGRLAREGRIPYRRIGHRLVFITAELETWLSRLPGVSVEQAVAAQQAHTDAITTRRQRPAAALQATA